MNIAIYIPTAYKNENSLLQQYIYESVSNLIQKRAAHKFYILIETGDINPFIKFPNLTVVELHKKVLKSILGNIRLTSLLKKLNADLFLTNNPGFISSRKFAQYCLVTNKTDIKTKFLVKANSVIVTSNRLKQTISQKVKFPMGKINVLLPFYLDNYTFCNEIEKIEVKNKYSDGREYFFYSSIFLSKNQFIELLKSFSQFKKRQQSSFKLILNVSLSHAFKETLSNYKHRVDIIFLKEQDKTLLNKITSAAYAVVLPFDTDDDQISILCSLKSGVPVIGKKSEELQELAGIVYLSDENEIIKETAGKMMELYTNESFRTKLIEEGKRYIEKYEKGVGAEELWRFIIPEDS